MLVEQINGLAVLLYTIYLLAVVIATWCLAYRRGRNDEREAYRRKHAIRAARVYKTPRTIPSSALPKVKQGTVYTIRRNHGYQAR